MLWLNYLHLVIENFFKHLVKFNQVSLASHFNKFYYRTEPTPHQLSTETKCSIRFGFVLPQKWLYNLGRHDIWQAQTRLLKCKCKASSVRC